MTQRTHKLTLHIVFDEPCSITDAGHYARKMLMANAGWDPKKYDLDQPPGNATRPSTMTIKSIVRYVARL